MTEYIIGKQSSQTVRTFADIADSIAYKQTFAIRNNFTDSSLTVYFDYKVKYGNFFVNSVTGNVFNLDLFVYEIDSINKILYVFDNIEVIPIKRGIEGKSIILKKNVYDFTFLPDGLISNDINGTVVLAINSSGITSENNYIIDILNVMTDPI